MSTAYELEKAIRKALPQYETEPSITKLAQLLSEVEQGNLVPNQAKQEIEKEESLIELVTHLLGHKIFTDRASLTFGQNNNIGDITLRDVAGRDIIYLSVQLPMKETKQKAVFPIVLLASFLVIPLLAFVGYRVYIAQSLLPNPTITQTVPSSPLSLEEQLLAVNIIPSADPAYIAEVQAQLSAPKSGYITLGNNCLIVLQGRRLKDRVGIDSVNIEYKKLLGRDPNQDISFSDYNNLDLYETAIFNAWKNLHGDSSANNAQLTSFEDIVQR